MEKELDSILQILERASTIEDYKELNQIEQQLQHYIKIINNSDFKDLDSSRNLNNELFLEFQKFIENRKFK